MSLAGTDALRDLHEWYRDWMGRYVREFGIVLRAMKSNDSDLTGPGNRALPGVSDQQDDQEQDDDRMSAEDAGYMELDGAQKDGDCKTVRVDGGVSRDLGCCNEFQPQQSTQKFSCGTCEYII